MKKIMLVLFLCVAAGVIYAQQTFPVNGVADERSGTYIFTNATIVKDAQTTLPNASLLIQQGKIIAVGNHITVPKDAVVVDCNGKYILPSFIDMYSDYGIPVPQRASRAFSYSTPAQLTSNTKGAYGWNEAIKADADAAALFATDNDKAKDFRAIGFGVALTHRKDGIARGTGTLVTLADKKENLVIIKEKASAHYAFSKGTSTQSYPTSLMGVIALLRQTYLDAAWYKNNPTAEGVNLSLQAWNNNQPLPQVFDAGDKWADLRADRIGDEFGVQYIIKGGGNEYQRIKEIAATGAAYILPVNYPQAMDVEDPDNARLVSLNDLKHWELAPVNTAAFEKAGINFCLTPADLKDSKQFLPNIRKAINNGLSEQKALEALTKTPAMLLGVYDKVGSIEAGKLANFLITSGPVFHEKTIVYQNWVQGEKYTVQDVDWEDIKGVYSLVLHSAKGDVTYTIDVKSSRAASIINADTLQTKFSFNGKLVNLSFPPGKNSKSLIRLSGVVNNDDAWKGNGSDEEGNALLWSANFIKPAAGKADSAQHRYVAPLAKITYPFGSYGWDERPQQQTVLFKNATVWTGEAEGNLTSTDVLVKDGRIAQVGKDISATDATIIDGTGKYLTAGIIDEHSHIATASINEGAQSVTSEVRIGDNLNPDDINIYRQLAGGVTSSQILHGSANTIGGQSQLIKLRWGADDEGLKFKGAAPFIKFALGENVKRTTSPANNRFPDTRMGVEQVLIDAFQRAVDYERALKSASVSKGKKKQAVNPFAAIRRDLELDALVEIMHQKRFITCHSYVQSEITYAMQVAEKFGFRINTFTHILEGYKVADKMKAHGANVSTFSDWFGYKVEVTDAIAYNAAIMQKMGLNVCINSDDAEMARRLNQEAAKTVKYGGVPEAEAWKMVTINPAKALHIDDRTGSIKAGKDADLVLWSDNPLSIYAKPEKTMVDGIVYFDLAHDIQLRGAISAERNRIIQKMVGEKKPGSPVAAFKPSSYITLSCSEDHGQDDHIILQ
ncbi:amidohydrolase family protein [Agriterribacter sp.]|uniref:amidohydrolase family protein n=1 Tax=Agriterribacter sp. TaxID=2821509 RepID=UPI002C51CC4F|nr:amidohydrolase family protein [Agriterribacter sp.]HTN07946.1 amidohydrolase family protein [Agriterribacter sp.]